MSNDYPSTESSQLQILQSGFKETVPSDVEKTSGISEESRPLPTLLPLQ
jgi:hypothetical protein